MNLYPLPFPEFVWARLGKEAYDKFLGADLDELDFLGSLFTDTLREYYFIGGRSGLQIFHCLPPAVFMILAKREDGSITRKTTSG